MPGFPQIIDDEEKALPFQQPGKLGLSRVGGLDIRTMTG
jgi:hypothetical protein